jgi:predicted DNA-binding protein
MSKIQLAVRIPEKLQETLDNYIGQTGATKTEVVINALAEYLNCAETVPLNERLAEFDKRLSCLEAKISAL